MPSRQHCPQHPLAPHLWGVPLSPTPSWVQILLDTGAGAGNPHWLHLLQRPEELGGRSDFSLVIFLCAFMLME